ncbi:MAG: PHP domain-containing protein [Chloroflexi bacterium]|nr:PHP domain-containing protein [Chloroflexota bacterium]MYG90008.1 PHP domain-containing protein [Chloroflexota bacterium]MYJ91923.1 PHP domain-containing protein [Chloroflexota bacterium]
MLIDMHTHTSVFSTDSNLLPHEALERAAERGLDGVILTEHDVLWPADRTARLAEQIGIVVLPGIEVTTELGHVLVYGLTEPFPRITDSKRLKAYCDERQALMYLAHPARDPGLRVPRAAMELFDGVEGLNGCDGPLQNQSASSRGRTRPLPPIGGSDSHALHEVGTAATEFAANIKSLSDLMAALRSGDYQPTTLPY